MSTEDGGDLSGFACSIIENCDLSQFRGGGTWFGDGAASITRWDDDSQRNIVRHCRGLNVLCVAANLEVAKIVADGASTAR